MLSCLVHLNSTYTMVHPTRVIYTKSASSFRTAFQLNNKSNLRWFPSHMGKGVKDMEKKLKSVDCIIEVHDARIPLSGRNPKSFQTISGLRPHLLVYNKRDLADDSLEKSILESFKASGFNNVIFTNCHDNKCKGVKSIIPIIQKLIKSSNRYNRNENIDSCLMIIGVPNVGKSSLINALRFKYLLKDGGASVGAVPGITRNVGFKIKISDDPLIYVLDTPGILTPNVPSVDVGMKLALCSNIPDKEVGIELIADYLLFWLNKFENFNYVDYMGIEQPNDNISEVLASFAIKNSLITKGKDVEGRWIYRPNLNAAAISFVDAFRRGLFGRITLDIDQINNNHLS